MTTEPVVVVGVGAEGVAALGPDACARLAAADQVWGSERLLGQLPASVAASTRRRTLGSGILAALAELRGRAETERIVLLASGDPGFFGLGSSLLEVLPPDEVVLVPAVSVLQAAFARARLAWHDAHLTSAHARPLAEVVGLARRFRKLGVLTDPRNTPARIAAALLAAGVPNCRAVVVERLGEPAEAVIDTDLAELTTRCCAALNVLLLVQGPDWRPAPAASSRPDDTYAHRDGLITKRDIRVLALARLALRETDVAWDIGAGSGAMSIEMSEQAWRGRVVAIERDPRCLDLVRTNVERFGALNVEVVAGEAPAALDGLSAPDAVFIGGSGGSLEAILARVTELAAPGCRLVATFALLENLVAAHAWLAEAGWTPSITQAQLATGEGIGAGTRLVPANPVFIVRAVRPEGGG